MVPWREFEHSANGLEAIQAIFRTAEMINIPILQPHIPA